jgi:hypothetical protein
MEPAITFRALTESDLPLLHAWLSRPHVTEWWEPTPTAEQVREDYLPRLAPPDMLPLDAPAGVVQYLAYEAGEPVAFVQAYRVMAHQVEGWWPDETDHRPARAPRPGAGHPHAESLCRVSVQRPAGDPHPDRSGSDERTGDRLLPQGGLPGRRRGRDARRPSAPDAHHA